MTTRTGWDASFWVLWSAYRKKTHSAPLTSQLKSQSENQRGSMTALPQKFRPSELANSDTGFHVKVAEFNVFEFSWCPTVKVRWGLGKCPPDLEWGSPRWTQMKLRILTQVTGFLLVSEIEFPFAWSPRIPGQQDRWSWKRYLCLHLPYCLRQQSCTTRLPSSTFQGKQVRKGLNLEERVHNTKELQDFSNLYIGRNLVNRCEWDSRSIRTKKVGYNRPNALIWNTYQDGLNMLFGLSLRTWT